MKSVVENVVKKLNVTKVRFALFVVFAVACVYAPLSIVWKYESTLRHGTLYKFRTAPVDPVDAFRGRYVTLAFADTALGDFKYKEYGGADFIYVRLGVDATGFAVPVEVSRTPLTGDDVVTATYTTRWRRDLGEMHINYPFNRYYLPEDIAPEAEKLYEEATRRVDDVSAQGYNAVAAAREAQRMPAYVTVRVRNGVGVLEELYLNGVPVREAVRARAGEMGKGKK